MTATTTTAYRATIHEAKRHFETGGKVLVSEYGREMTQSVGPDTTTHDRTTTTWDVLVSQVNEWRHRYPNQRYYIVTEPAEVEPAQTEPAEPTLCYYCGEPITNVGEPVTGEPGGDVWVDGTDGDCCSGNDDGVNENGVHEPVLYWSDLVVDQ